MNNNGSNPDKRWENIAIFPFALIFAILNIVILIATVVNRKRLQRQYYVFACVISILASNVIFLVFEMWILLDQYLGIYMGEQQQKTLWAICHAAAISMVLVMYGNVGALLFVLRDGTYFVGRNISREVSEFIGDCDVKEEKAKQCKKGAWSTKRRRGMLTIAGTWIAPFVLTLAVVLKWSCTDECTVLETGRSGLIGYCPEGAGCSQIWAPMRQSYLGLVIGLWTLESIGLLAIIGSGIHELHTVMTPPSTARSSSPPAPNEQEKKRAELISCFRVTQIVVENSTVYGCQHLDGEITIPEVARDDTSQQADSKEIGIGFDLQADVISPTPDVVTVALHNKDGYVQDKTAAPEPSQPRAAPEPRQPRRKRFYFHTRINFMIAISSVFFACSLPFVICVLVEISTNSMNYGAALISSKLFFLLYTLLCPIILLRSLPNLRSIVVVLTQNCCSCDRHKTNNKRKSTRSEAAPSVA